jgi:DNA-binding response OmpR family regulator
MSTQRILIVEDHEPTRNILGSIFRRQGWETLAAGTMAEGLSLLEESPTPDCLLLDLDLPDGRGEAILRKIREENLPVRVAVCTGMGDPGRWSTVQGLDPEALLQKPIDVAEVCTAFVG